MIEVNDKKVLNMFKLLKSKQEEKVFKDAVRHSLNIIKKLAESNLKGVVKVSLTKKDKWGNTLKKGIRVKPEKKGLSGMVHIMRNFKLKFFLNGTNERHIKHFKKKSYGENEGPTRGSILASYFFTNAINEKESEVLKNLDHNIRDSINKISRKYL